jgi:hypothetical protein
MVVETRYGAAVQATLAQRKARICVCLQEPEGWSSWEGNAAYAHGRRRNDACR